ncbi:hypothetical protein [Kroppenstedtia guangzhouensis]|uniref:hypothetical protein n=1 Tax=Kroppenstedtia guangzhouensis TaxID=1274356 RepID=UPI00166BE7F3|nr:hypothetical protein [Kroppenstedtia guangzhouensis]
MKFFKWLKGLFENWKLKLLRLLAFIGSLAVFVCMQAVSISHTLALAEAHQYHGWEAIAFVAGVEIAFVVGLLLIILDRAHGRPLNPGTIVFFFIPTMVVGAANLRSGMGYGVVGLALGVVPPSLVLAVEKVLTNTSTNQPAKRKGRGWLTRIFGQWSASNQPTGQPLAESTNHQPAVSQTVKVSQPKTATQPESTSQPTNQVAGSTSHQSTNQPATTKISQPSANHSATSASVNQPAKTTKSANIDQAVADQPKSATTNESANQPAESTNHPPARVNQPVETANQPTSQKKDSQPATTNQPTKTDKGVAKSTIQPNSKVAEMAEEYRRENGKWPSQRGLAEMAGVTRHQAAKVLGWLKKQPADESANQPAKANG